MSTAAAHATTFYVDAATHRVVFTLLEDDSFLVLRVGGTEVIPFWSTRARIQKMQELHPKYSGYAIEEIPLSKFMSTTLDLLAAESIRVGVNWSGERLTGYDLSVDDLRRNIGHHLRDEG